MFLETELLEVHFFLRKKLWVMVEFYHPLTVHMQSLSRECDGNTHFTIGVMNDGILKLSLFSLIHFMRLRKGERNPSLLIGWVHVTKQFQQLICFIQSRR